MTGFSELRVNCLACPQAARPIRHAVAAFLGAAGYADGDISDNILMAVGEALANAVEHAYNGVESNAVELFARVEHDHTLTVDVFDRGTFIKRTAPLAGRGFGMRIVEAFADAVTVNVDDGTHVRMIFKLPVNADRKGIAS